VIPSLSEGSYVVYVPAKQGFGLTNVGSLNYTGAGGQDQPQWTLTGTDAKTGALNDGLYGSVSTPSQTNPITLNDTNGNAEVTVNSRPLRYIVIYHNRCQSDPTHTTYLTYTDNGFTRSDSCSSARPNPLTHNGNDYAYQSTVLNFGVSPIAQWQAPSGKYFVGWNTACDGTGTTYHVNDSLTGLTSDIDLYAQFDDNPTYSISVFFDTVEINENSISVN
jgi:hypothetical protein